MAAVTRWLEVLFIKIKKKEEETYIWRENNAQILGDRDVKFDKF